MLVNGGFGCGKQQLCLCLCGCVVVWMLGWVGLMFHLGRHLACASVFFSLVPQASLFVSLVSPVFVNWDMFDDHC